ncbi:YitT family protein [Nitrincola sp.]|uniref:YitT family protein n=1 Tax=Nitrincola sp. TaxID=1926584 RepID=UPI003A95588B
MTPTTPLYDIQGLAFGITMSSLGVVILQACGFVTGQLAGLSMLLALTTPLGFGLIYSLVSLPFCVLAWYKKGKAFTLRTAVAVLGISLMTSYMTNAITIEQMPPLLGALLAGCCIGVGLIALFRHNASAGGFGVLALYIEARSGFKSGWSQMLFDATIFTAAFFTIDIYAAFYSLVCAIIVNLLIAWNFRLQPPVPDPLKSHES